jgi:two-component system sensor histidine kinase/response regulator
MGILVVDDQPSIRLMLETILKDAGYTNVLTAGSSGEAFNLLGMDESSSPVAGVDLVLMDISMPEIDGIEACRRVKAVPQLMDISMPEIDGIEACRRVKAVPQLRDLPIIMVTGLVDTNDLQTAFAAGAVDYITKPPNIGEMLARVHSALEAKHEMDRRKSAYVTNLEEKNRELELAFAELEQKNRELEAASLAKTQILSTATHELKTPLTSIVGYVDRILLRQDRVGPLNEKQQRYLETVQKNARRLKALVDDLLDVSRIEAGSLELTLLELDVRHEIIDAIQLMQNQIGEKRIRLELNIPSDLGRINADQLRFCQVISNLISNACKYSPSGATVTVTAQEASGLIQIDVSDTGIGISEEDQARLFSKFFRADNTSTREASGTALGLYITKHLIEAHGGDIWAESQLGKGTTFHFTWPRYDDSFENRERPAPVELTPTLSEKTVEM